MSNIERSLTGVAPRHAWVAETGTAMQLPAGVLDATVTTVRVVVHTMGYVQANPRSENHWTIYLLLHSMESVQINFRVGSADEDDRMTIEHRSYAVSRSAIEYWDFAAEKTATVRKFLQCIYTRDRDSYRMNPTGQGCHYWVYVAHFTTSMLILWKLHPHPGGSLTVVSDFSKTNLCSVRSTQNRAIEDLIAYNYSLDQPAQAIEITRGEFIYRPTTDRPTLPTEQISRHEARGQTLPSPAEQSSRHSAGSQPVQDTTKRVVTGQRLNHKGEDGLLLDLGERKIFVPAKNWARTKVNGKDALYCERLKVYYMLN